MSMIARGFALALIVVAGIAPTMSVAEKRADELAPLAAWVGKSTQKAALEGRVARALGFNKDGKPMQLVAVTTAYLDGSRIVYLAPGNQILFAQGKARQGTWMLTNATGTLVRALEWMPTSANPAPADAAKAGPLFAETKAFWKAQLGRPVR